MTWATFARAAAAALVLAAAVGCRKALEETPAARVAATVGEREITVADVYRGLYPQGRPDDAKASPAAARRVVDQLVERELILAWAADNGVRVDDAEVAARQALVEADYNPRNFESYLKTQGLSVKAFREVIRDDLTVEAAIEKAVVAKVSVSYDDVVAYYDSRRADFERPVEYHILQIVTADRARAEEALAKLQYGSAFEEVARELSMSPDRHIGGDVGYTKLDALPAAVAKAVASLAPGETSGVIETPYGFEVVKVLQVRGAGLRPLAEVRSDIEDRLRTEKEAAAYREWLAGLKAGAKISIDEKVIASL